MAMLTSGQPTTFLPEQIARLIVLPVTQRSVALQVATVIQTGGHGLRVPLVDTDPTAGWTAEGVEITPSDADLGEALIEFHKVAGLTIITNELASDSSPAAAQVVGDGLARDIARKLDAAFFGALALPAPSGLAALVGTTPISSAAFVDLDPFLDAQSAAETNGATITAWVANPADALAIAKIRTQVDSNATLLQLGGDPTQPTRRMIAGVPLYVSPAVTVGTVWGIPKDRVIIAMRNDTKLDVDRSVFFTSDRSAIRATMRVGFGFVQPDAIVEIST